MVAGGQCVLFKSWRPLCLLKFREEHPTVVLATTGFYYTLMHAFKLLIHQGKKKKEKSPPIVWMSYIIDRGWGRRKKSAADLLETRQPRKPESTFFQQGRERSNHSYPSFGGMRNRATWNLHSPQTSTYWTPVRLEAGMSFSTGGTSSSSTHVYSRPGAFAFGAHPDRLHRNWRGL